MLLKILFWLPLILILHTYVLYPLLLLILNRFSSKTETDVSLPGTRSVSVLMAVHNEERVIRQKIEALFRSDYPEGLLEVIVGSDCSVDSTNSILRELSAVYPRLRVIIFSERTGKPGIINRLSEESAGEILIITDANVIPESDTVKKLAGNFNDMKVGLADSWLLKTGQRRDGIGLPETAYLGFESKLKYIEGRLWGATMGPFGGFYAVRKSSYLPNSDDTLADDFRICMNVMKRGEMAISDPRAVVYEDSPNSLADEFSRKVRIAAGNFQNLRFFSGLLLNPFSRISFCFISHKVLRWLTPLFWLILVTCNILLVKSSIFFFLFLILQVIFIILPPLDILLRKTGINILPLRFLTHLWLMNAALFTGLVRFMTGIKSGVWTPTKRFQ
jgi:cellulose synthase/poly-beta-1,6-N-acetylglucosamine synthase-like glycosyltransferase